MKSFYIPEYETPLDSTFTSLHTSHADYSATSRFQPFSFNWPHAQEHPFFYIGIYAAITLGGALVNIIAAATQYTGALRASRVLFKQLLVTVVRATMRWHDVTTQGVYISANIILTRRRRISYLISPRPNAQPI